MKRTVTIDVDPSPEELANAFAAMDGTGQAKFFNFLYKCDKAWKSSWPFQLQWVTDDDELTDDGREMMRLIGAYAEAETNDR